MILFRKAILLIHGFAGGNYDYNSLGNDLQLYRDFDVYTFTLPGHDKTIINHSHFHCLKCSKVFDIEVNLDSKNIEKNNNCKIISEDIVISGICQNCLKKEG